MREITERACLRLFCFLRPLTIRIVITGNKNILLIQLDKFPSVPANGQRTMLVYETMQGYRTLSTCRYGIDGEFRPCIHITTR